MLNTLRKGAATWVAKFFMVILVLSFGIWGIADIFSGYGQQSLAKVGEIEITPEEYDFSLRQQIKRLSQQFGQPISGEQARAFGIDRQVLNSLITNAAVDQQALTLGLGVSDRLLIDEIQNIKAFQGEDGKFDRALFNEVLRNNDMNEAMFLREQRSGAVREQLISAVAADNYVPEAMRDALNRYDNDTRVAEYFILPKSAVGAPKEPDEAEQKAFLEANKQNFTAPETRKIGVLTLEADEVRKSIEVSDADVAADYQSRIDQFTIPGKRHLLRMSFIDREQAAKAKADLDGGGDFMQVAAKYGFKQEGTDLGFVNRDDISDRLVAEAAFSLKDGETSKPLQADLSTVIIKVAGIDPAVVQKPLDEVKDQIRDYLASERAAEKIATLQDTIEDERAGGQALRDIAGNMKLAYKMAEAIDAEGNGADGKRVADIPAIKPLLDAAFESDVGVDNDPVEGDAGSLYWFEVLGITPQRIKQLDEVRAEVIAGWKAQETEKAQAKLAADLLESLKNGKALAEMAKPYKAEVKKTKPFKRAEEHDDLPPAAVTQVFALPVGGFGFSLLDKDRGRVIFRVVEKQDAPALDKEAADKLAKRLQSQLETDRVSEFIAGLRDSYGVSVNQQVLRRLSGVTE